MSRDLCNWLSFNPLGEVLYGNDEVLHLTYGKGENSQKYLSPMYGKAMGYK